MNTSTVTVRRLAHELGVERVKIKHYCRYRKLGRSEGKGGAGRHIVLTETEAETIRQELRPRLMLPEAEQVEANLGLPVYPAIEAAKQLGMDRHTFQNYGHDLGVLIQIRNGIFPTYVVTADGMTAIWEAQQEAKKRVAAMLREQAQAASQIGSRTSQHKALMREEKDYYGKVQAFLMEPAVVQDPELSSETGPQMTTMQWRPFYPSDDPKPDLDLSVWHVSDHRQHLSLESMLEDGDQI